MYFYEKLKAIRSAMNLTQAQFAERTGFSLGGIKGIEKASAKSKIPSGEMFQAIGNDPEMSKFIQWFCSEKGDSFTPSSQVSPDDVSLEGVNGVESEDKSEKLKKALVMMGGLGWFDFREDVDLDLVADVLLKELGMSKVATQSNEAKQG